jgi:hypothetical protein
MSSTTDAILIATLLLAGAIFWWLKVRPASGQAAATPSDAPPLPPNVAGGAIPQPALGQNAVAPDRQWLVIPRGQ